MSVFSNAMKAVKNKVVSTVNKAKTAVKNVVSQAKANPVKTAVNVAKTVVKASSPGAGAAAAAKAVKAVTSSKSSSSSSNKRSSSNKSSSAPKVSAPKVSSYVAPKTTSTPTSSFASSLNSVKNNIIQSARDAGVSKAYADTGYSPEESTQGSSAVSSLLNAFGNLGTPDLAISEMFGGNKTSLLKQIKNQGFPLLPTQIAGLLQPLGLVNSGRGILNAATPVDYSNSFSSSPSSRGIVLSPTSYITNNKTQSVVTNPYNMLKGTNGQNIVTTPPSSNTNIANKDYSTPNPEYASIPGVNAPLGDTATVDQLQLPEQTQQPPADFLNNILKDAGVLLGEDVMYGGMGDVFADDQTYLTDKAANDMSMVQTAYDKLLAKYPSLIGDEKARAEETLNSLRSYLDNAQSSGKASKETVANTYGELMRSAAKNKKLQDLQRRNMFSNLGTAESSAFIDAQTGADTQFNTDISGAEREKAGKISDIDTQVREVENYVGSETTNTIKKLNDYIRQVQAEQSLTEEQKAQAIQSARLDATAAVSNLLQQKNDYYTNLGLNRQNLKLGLAQTMLAGPYAQQLMALRGGTAATPSTSSGSYGQSVNKAYPIASVAGGYTKYSDGTIRDAMGNIIQNSSYAY